MKTADYTWTIKYTGFSTPCWIWNGQKNPKGYGRWWISGTRTYKMAHNMVYQNAGRIIPPNMILDHLCRVTSCVNPDHLEPTTNKNNILRGIGYSAINARKTQCINGHDFGGNNLIFRIDGSRVCKICKRKRWRDYYRKRILRRKMELP